MAQIMNYEPGMLRVSTGYHEPGEANDWEGSPYGIDPGEFYLPHSCDEWVIGDRACAEALLADLKRLIEQLPVKGTT